MLQRILEEIRTQPAEAPLWNRLNGYFNGMGFDKVIYHHFWGRPDDKRAMTLMVDGVPRDWIDRYAAEQKFVDDPITNYARSATEPFLWSEIGSLMRLTNAHRDYLDEMRAAVIGDGIAFQVYGPGLRNGVVGLGFGPDRTSVTAQERAELHMVVQSGHVRFCQYYHSDGVGLNLSPRELEVLGWMARGKSNASIAQILDVSRHTVDTVVRRIFEKLDVSDRTAAAVMAIQAGMILPQENGFTILGIPSEMKTNSL